MIIEIILFSSESFTSSYFSICFFSSMSSMVTGGHHHHHHHHPASSYPYMFHHPPPDSLYNHPVSSSPRVPCQPAPAHSVNANTHPAAYPTSTHHASNTSPGATGTGNYTLFIGFLINFDS